MANYKPLNLLNQSLPPDQPEWARRDDQLSWPIWDGFPRQYRCNQEEGSFYRGSELVDTKLTLLIFDHRWDEEVARWGYPRQSWLDVAFVDDEGVVGICSFKKESAINLHVWLTRLESKTYPWACRVKLQIDEREAREGGVYGVAIVAETAWINAVEFQLIEDFRQSAQFRWLLTGEVMDGDYGYEGSDY